MLKHKENDKSLQEISTNVGYSKSSMQTVLRNYKKNKTINNTPRSGRSSKITQRVKRHIVNEVG